jgi:hypothetical protein
MRQSVVVLTPSCFASGFGLMIWSSVETLDVCCTRQLSHANSLENRSGQEFA